ncbi:endonuclease domain-containing 1 protein-like [Megalobrama amblycephala]|uniref:endonuclease domain-containing 1 protein-like n=1 Tax=Megalobrama amblycephala TaxID=75352 RepID=UPI002014586B|nr:endonuclease domain-containing 1 protein-like [Megalobrama amblycephala]
MLASLLAKSHSIQASDVRYETLDVTVTESVQVKMRLFVIISVLLVLGFPFIMTEVVKKFSTCSNFFFEDQPPEIEGVLKNSASQDNNRYKLICQKYDNKYRFATLYDTVKRIPIFSAYKYTGHYDEKPHIPWMMEPQLEPLDGKMSEPGTNQATGGDYWDQEIPDELERGHLFPNGHAADKINAKSTYTLTNTVPQKKSFNSGSWRDMEQKVRKSMDSNCRDKKNPNNILAYVLTGALPGNTLLNDRVDIPSHMWTVFCCFNTKTKAWESKAHWAENKSEKKPNPVIAEKTLKQLEEFLWNKYKQSSLFSEDCYNYFTLKKSSSPEDEL